MSRSRGSFTLPTLTICGKSEGIPLSAVPKTRSVPWSSIIISPTEAMALMRSRSKGGPRREAPLDDIEDGEIGDRPEQPGSDPGEDQGHQEIHVERGVEDEERVRPQHVYLAMGKVQDLRAPEDEVDAEDDEHVEHAEAEAVYHELGEELNAHLSPLSPEQPLIIPIHPCGRTPFP